MIKTAHQAAAQAQEYYGTRTFDFAGVVQYLRNSWQIEEFRKVATGKGLEGRPAGREPGRAGEAHRRGGRVVKKAEASGAFIREPPMALLSRAKDTARAIDREMQQRFQAARGDLPGARP